LRNFKFLNSSIFYSKVPPSIKPRTDDHASYRERSADKKIDDIVVSEIDRRKDETTNKGEENIE
jgi:hypothetical protein